MTDPLDAFEDQVRAARDYGVALTAADPPALDRRATDDLRRQGHV